MPLWCLENPLEHSHAMQHRKDSSPRWKLLSKLHAMLTSMNGGYSSHFFFSFNMKQAASATTVFGLVPISCVKCKLCFYDFCKSTFYTLFFVSWSFLLKEQKMSVFVCGLYFRSLLKYHQVIPQERAKITLYRNLGIMYRTLQTGQHVSWSLTAEQSGFWVDAPKESRQGREGSHLYQTSTTIRESLVMVTDQRLRVWKFKYILGSMCLFGYIPGWGAIKSMSLKFLASQTPAAKSPKLRIKFLRKSFLSVAKR